MDDSDPEPAPDAPVSRVLSVVTVVLLGIATFGVGFVSATPTTASAAPAPVVAFVPTPSTGRVNAAPPVTDAQQEAAWGQEAQLEADNAARAAAAAAAAQAAQQAAADAAEKAARSRSRTTPVATAAPAAPPPLTCPSGSAPDPSGTVCVPTLPTPTDSPSPDPGTTSSS